MWSTTLLLTLLGLYVRHTAGAAVQCEPSRRPFNIEHEEYCDKYYVCSNGKATEESCEDGLLFDIDKEKCELPFVVDCGDREKLQEARPTTNCPRRNGMFPVQGTCDQFYHCTDGLHTLIKCPPGVIFEPSVGACVHPDQTNRVNCSAAKVLDFQCPNVGASSKLLRFGDHDRLAHPTSCRHFYMCLLTGMPRLGGCTYGLVFNPVSGRCDLAKNVPGCENWYGEEDEELSEEDGEPIAISSPAPPKRINNSAIRPSPTPLSPTTVATSTTRSTPAVDPEVDETESVTVGTTARTNAQPIRRIANNNRFSRTRTVQEE